MPATPDQHRFHEASLGQRELGLWVSGVGQMRQSQERPGCRNRQLPCFGVVLVAEGSGFFHSEATGRQAVHAPCLLWLFPEVAHSYGSAPRWRERWMLFDGAMASAFHRQGFIDPHRAMQALGDGLAPADIEGCFARAWQAFTDGGPLAVPLAAAAVHELIVRAHAQHSGLLGGASTDDALVARAVALLDAEATDSISPREIAERLGVAYPTLRRRFRRQTGYSLQDYAISVRLRHARELLHGSELSIGAIAERCGFHDPYYFSRLFTARVGVSPSAFRRHGLP